MKWTSFSHWRDTIIMQPHEQPQQNVWNFTAGHENVYIDSILNEENMNCCKKNLYLS